jgi:hypothetical protein
VLDEQVSVSETLSALLIEIESFRIVEVSNFQKLRMNQRGFVSLDEFSAQIQHAFAMRQQGEYLIILRLSEPFRTLPQHCSVCVQYTDASLASNCILDVFKEEVPDGFMLVHVDKQGLVQRQAL